MTPQPETSIMCKLLSFRILAMEKHSLRGRVIIEIDIKIINVITYMAEI